MNKEKLLKFLQSNGNINPELAEKISEQFQEKHIAKNEFFLKEGQVNNDYLFLEEGFMRGFCFDTEGNEVTTSFYSGMPVFEVSSFFTRTPSKENIQALTDCSGHMLTFEQLNGLFHTIPEFREFGRSVLVRGFASLKTRMLSMISETAEERYASLMKARPEIFQHAPLKTIASYLGITDTSLSRIRKELVKK